MSSTHSDDWVAGDALFTLLQMRGLCKGDRVKLKVVTKNDRTFRKEQNVVADCALVVEPIDEHDVFAVYHPLRRTRLLYVASSNIVGWKPPEKP